MSSTYKKLLFVVISFTANLAAMAEPSPFELRIEPSSRITYEPFSGLPGNEILAVHLDLSDASEDSSNSPAQVNRNNRYRIKFRTENNLEFLAVNNSFELPIALSPLQRPNGFRKFNNEFHQDLRTNGQRLRPQKLDFKLTVPESMYAEPGVYTLPIIVELVDILTDRVFDSATINAEILVAIKLQTNIAGTSDFSRGRVRVPVIDFGVLETAESRRVSIQVRGNTHARIRVKSDNQGRLQHTKERDLFVDYSVNVDGEDSSLERPLNLQRNVAKTIEGSAYPMTVTIGNLKGAFAGSYRDTITVEVRPQ